MEPIIFIHGSGQKADSWRETVSFLPYKETILCPELSAILKGQKASYSNLCAAFASYCAQAGTPVHLCGLCSPKYHIPSFAPIRLHRNGL